MACCLMAPNLYLNQYNLLSSWPLGTNCWKLVFKIEILLVKKCFWKYCLQTVGQFAQLSMCENCIIGRETLPITNRLYA